MFHNFLDQFLSSWLECIPIVINRRVNIEIDTNNSHSSTTGQLTYTTESCTDNLKYNLLSDLSALMLLFVNLYYVNSTLDIF